MSNVSPITKEQFLAKIPHSDYLTVDICWEWQGVVHTEGYGCAYKWNSALGRTITMNASRASYLLFKGSIATGLQVLHICDNKLCVNPNHLELGTALKNRQDALNRGLTPIGEKHQNAILKDEQIIAILNEPKTISNIALGRKYGVTHQTISLYRKGYGRAKNLIGKVVVSDSSLSINN
jgi:hypothetical protein